MLRRAALLHRMRQERGVELQHPSWDGSDSGWVPMPISQIASVPRID
jgi:hypothetical protein